MSELPLSDWGYIEGRAGALIAGIGLTYGAEDVFDLYDAEYAPFVYGGAGMDSTLIGGNLSLYNGLVRGWSRTTTGNVTGYAGPFESWSVGVSPFPVAFASAGIGGMYFQSPDQSMWGVAAFISLSVSPNNAKISGGYYETLYADPSAYRAFHDPGAPADWLDELEFSAFIATHGFANAAKVGTAISPFFLAGRGTAIGILLGTD
jgi:hypothetical protein